MALFPHHRVTHCSRFESITKSTLLVIARLLTAVRFLRVSDSSEVGQCVFSCCVASLLISLLPRCLHSVRVARFAVVSGALCNNKRNVGRINSMAGDKQGCDFNSVEIDGIRNFNLVDLHRFNPIEFDRFRNFRHKKTHVQDGFLSETLQQSEVSINANG